MSAPAPVSVLIATRHRPEALRRALASIAAQACAPAEVLVLDNASDAPLDAACLSAGAAPVRVLRVAAPLGVGAARRLLCEAASAPLALLLDDDAWLYTPDTIKRIATHFNTHPQSAALALLIEDHRRTVPLWLTPFGARSFQPTGPAQRATYFIGCAHALRLPFVRAAGGYDLHLHTARKSLTLPSAS